MYHTREHVVSVGIEEFFDDFIMNNLLEKRKICVKKKKTMYIV